MTSQTNNFDNFFVPISNTKPYFKANFYGFAGTGKSFTAAQTAIGLHQKIKSKKPVIIFDTEKASKFLKPIFAEAGIEVMVKESRSLADLKETMTRMRNGFSDILIIDSVSHLWENFLEAYKNKVGRRQLQFQDWGIIKPSWKTEFSDPFVNDPYNIIMCGRAGYEYENEKNAETGRREIYKSGIKEKVEGETAYESDFLVLMERYEEVLTDNKKVWREATIIKDRSTLLDGKTFKNPTFQDFAPSIDVMLNEPSKIPASPEADARDLFHTEEEKNEWKKRKTVLLEQIENVLLKAFPGMGAKEKVNRLKACEMAFNKENIAWAEIEQMSVARLETGYTELREVIKSLLANSQKEIENIKGENTPETETPKKVNKIASKK